MTISARYLRYVVALTACTALLASPLSVAQSKPAPKQPAWGGSDSPLRPGASLGGCTFNFVFYKPGTKSSPPKGYIGTAGHCTDELAEKVSQPELGEIGEVVYDSDLVESGVDFSLIEIYPQFISKTNPEVLHWGGPTRPSNDEDLQQGDRIDVYGYGIGFGSAEQTRPRYGVLFSWTDEEYKADMPAVNGDSGAPLIHHETGAAFGIISRYGLPDPFTGDVVASTDLGPRIGWILEELATAGFNVRLATVRDYEPI
jgi:hypothetical protein